MRLGFIRIAAVVLALLAASAVSARAEIIVLTSGRTISVKAHRIQGESIVLTLRTGGEVTCDRSLIEKILPDEVPYPEPVVAQAQNGDVQQIADAGELLRATPYGEIIAAMSEAHGVDPLLVRALIQVESNYKPGARSRKGAMGLMQLMPATARTYNVRNPFDPRANIEAGVKHLRSLIDRFGIELALAAYNAGEGAVAKFNDVPPYRETRTYVSRILSIAGIK
jgi:soluble lytic murein transglycosylase-like protein